MALARSPRAELLQLHWARCEGVPVSTGSFPCPAPRLGSASEADGACDSVVSAPDLMSLFAPACARASGSHHTRNSPAPCCCICG